MERLRSKRGFWRGSVTERRIAQHEARSCGLNGMMRKIARLCGLPKMDTLRVFVWAETRTHRPVFTPDAHAKRGSPTLAALPAHPSVSDLVTAFASSAATALPRSPPLTPEALADPATGLVSRKAGAQWMAHY